MKRRHFLGTAGAGALLTGGLISGCGQEAKQAGAGVASEQQTFSWKMVTTWPKNFPGLGTGANNLASLIEANERRPHHGKGLRCQRTGTGI